MRKALITAIILFISLFSLYAENATTTVSLDTSKLEIFQCGFTEDPNPISPVNALGLSTYAIGTGGITPAGVIEILPHTNGTQLEIKSKIYTIWALKIGSKNVIINLNAGPLEYNKINIPYGLFIDSNRPESLSTPTVTVDKEIVTYRIPNTEMDGHFIKFWTTKFMIRVPGLPSNVEAGTYKGNLTLTITST